MPLPKPNPGEKQEDFIGRCMGNPTVLQDFPDQKQRAGVCYSQWNQKKEVAEVDEKTGIRKALDDFGGWIINKFRKDTGAFDAEYSKDMEEVAGEEDGEKQATKTEGGIRFRASDYAVVPDEEKPSTWKLRLAESRSGDFTVAQIARAITAMQPGGFRGQQAELSPQDKAQAVSRIGAAIAKCDGDDNQKKNLRTRLNRVKEIAENVNTSFWIVKDLKETGRLRWYGFPSNKWRDRDYPAQIISEEAHKEFVEYLNTTKDFPVLLSWHQAGTRIGQADWAEYEKGFLIMGGLIDKDKHAEAERLAEKCRTEAIGMSHGFVYSYADKEKEIIGKYRTWEVSHLPLSKAANVWTSIDLIRKEVKETMLSEEKKAYLIGLHGQDVVDQILNKAADLEKDLLSAGIEFKEMVEPEIIEKEVDTNAVVEQTAKAIVESEGFKSIVTTIAGIEESLKDLKETVIPGLEKKVTDVEQKTQKSQDDIIADAMKARSATYQASKEGPAPTEEESKEGKGPESELPYDVDMMNALSGGINFGTVIAQ